MRASSGGFSTSDRPATRGHFARAQCLALALKARSSQSGLLRVRSGHTCAVHINSDHFLKTATERVGTNEANRDPGQQEMTCDKHLRASLTPFYSARPG